MRFSWLAALCLLQAAPSLARPYSVDDLLRLEGYGQMVVDPSRRWAVAERRDRFDSAARYRYDWFTRRLVSKLLLVDLAGKQATSPLFRQDPAAGYWSGGFSPTGKRLSVVRLAKDQVRVGVVDMSRRRVRWLDVVPDLPDAHPAPIWIDDDRLILVTLDDGELPALFQTPNYAQRASIAGWSQAEGGKVASATILGSGRYLGRGSTWRQRRVTEVDIVTGKHRTLFQGDVLDIALSGDGRRLAVLTKGPPVQPDPKAAIDPAFEPRRQRLTVLDLATGAMQDPCRGCDILPSLLHWAPDAPELLFYARTDSARWSEGRLYRFDARTGLNDTPLPEGLRPVTQIGGGSARFVRAGWAGSHPLVFAERPDGRRDWYRLGRDKSAVALTASLATAPSELAAVGPTHYYVGDGSGIWRGDWTGELIRVVDGPAVSVRVTLLDAHSVGTRNWMTAIPSRLLAVTRSGDGLRATAEDAQGRLGTHRLDGRDKVLAASGAGALLVLGEDDHGVGSLARIDREGRSVVDQINRHLAGVTPARQILLHTRAADGTLLNHWLTLPTIAGDKRPRLVVVPYPGFPFGGEPPRDSRPSTPSLMTHPLLLASQGYAVFQPSIPLAEGPGDPLEAIASELVKAVDAALASGFVSPERPFLLGHSYGGYTVLGMASISDRFAGVVAASGIYDLASVYGSADPRFDYGLNGISLTIPMGWAEGGQGRMGVPPWAAVERYARNSAFYHIQDIHIPVFLMSADLDYVPVSQAERMFLALYREGKDAMLLRYRGESHSLTSPANLRDYWSRVFAFFHGIQDDRPQ